MLNYDQSKTGGHCIRTHTTDKILTPPLNYDPAYTVLNYCEDFSFSYWVSISLFLTSVCIFLQLNPTEYSRHWNYISQNSTLNCNSGSWFVELSVTLSIDSMLHSDPRSWFNLKLWPWVMNPCWIVTRVTIPGWIVTPCRKSALNCDPIVTLCRNSALNCDPRSWFKIWIMARGLNSTLYLGQSHDSLINCDLGSRSQINMKILTRGHNSMWNFDPG